MAKVRIGETETEDDHFSTMDRDTPQCPYKMAWIGNEVLSICLNYSQDPH